MFYPLAAWIAPFVKTPTNIMLQTIRRTPLGIYSLLKRHKEGKFKSELTGKQELYDEIGKLLVGNILGAGFVTMGLSGLITGGGTGDPEKDELKKAAGWQPYSVKLANGTHISYSRVEPISSVMGIAADLAEGYRQGDHETVNKLSKRLAGTLVENLTHKTFLSGLEGVFTMFSDPGRYMDRWVRQQVAGAFPNTDATAMSRA